MCHRQAKRQANRQTDRRERLFFPASGQRSSGVVVFSGAVVFRGAVVLKGSGKGRWSFTRRNVC